jgi:uncharacterized membrane protein HdeD (DUF308 family)
MAVELIFHRAVAQQWWVVALRGLAYLLFGIAALLAPGLTLVLLTVWVAAFMAVDGALAAVAGINAIRHHKHGAALLAEGVLGLLIALLVLVWPVAGIATVVLLIAAWALITGAALLYAAIALPLQAGRFWMAATAILSLALGVVLFAHPVAGALVLAWWLGAYAMVSGVLLLSLAFSLRGALHRAAALP